MHEDDEGIQIKILSGQIRLLIELEARQIENSSRNQSQMALPSLFKEGCDKACGWGNPFHSFLLIVLVPSTSTSSASQRHFFEHSDKN